MQTVLGGGGGCSQGASWRDHVLEGTVSWRDRVQEGPFLEGPCPGGAVSWRGQV